jgi:hypothetical protein
MATTEFTLGDPTLARLERTDTGTFLVPLHDGKTELVA